MGVHHALFHDLKVQEDTVGVGILPPRFHLDIEHVEALALSTAICPSRLTCQSLDYSSVVASSLCRLVLLWRIPLRLQIVRRGP